MDACGLGADGLPPADLLVAPAGSHEAQHLELLSCGQGGQRSWTSSGLDLGHSYPLGEDGETVRGEPDTESPAVRQRLIEQRLETGAVTGRRQVSSQPDLCVGHEVHRRRRRVQERQERLPYVTAIRGSASARPSHTRDMVVGPLPRSPDARRRTALAVPRHPVVPRPRHPWPRVATSVGGRPATGAPGGRGSTPTPARGCRSARRTRRRSASAVPRTAASAGPTSRRPASGARPRPRRRASSSRHRCSQASKRSTWVRCADGGSSITASAIRSAAVDH